MNETKMQSDIEDINDAIRFVRTDIWEISEFADDFLANVRSIFTITLLLIFFAGLGLKPPIEASNLMNSIVSFLYWWIFVCFATAIIVVPFFFFALLKKRDIKLELISRISLILVTMLSLLPQTAPLIRSAGIIGVFIEVVLYLVFGRWFLFPGEPFTRLYKGSKMERRRLAEESLTRASRDTNTIPNTLR